MLRVSRTARATALLVAAAVLPFVPGAWQFIARGVPDVLFTGDGAALELGVLHAARGVQLLGPYSQFGWSHPGPAFFYLALPIYELFGERGPALNLFAFAANCAVTIALVLTMRRLVGFLAALAVAALLAVYTLVGAPFLLANEWNPILPILPLVLLSLLTVRIAVGETAVLPAAAFLASFVVQTHVAYGGPVAALAAVALIARPQIPRRTLMATAAVLAVCWALPFYEAATARPGNIPRLIAFFAPGNLAEQSWSAAVRAVAGQLAVMPLAIARTFRLPIELLAGRWTMILAGVQLAALVAVVMSSRRRGERGVTVLSTIALLQIVVSVAAVRAIRGEIAFYLIAWISVLGFLSWAAMAAWLVSTLARATRAATAQVAVGGAAALLIGLALSEPVPRGPVFRDRDRAAEALAGAVATHLMATAGDAHTVGIVSRDAWPTAVAVVLHLYKRRIPIFVEDAWLFMVGRPFAAPAGADRGLLFGDRAFHERAATRGDLTLIAATEDVYVYAGDSR